MKIFKIHPFLPLPLRFVMSSTACPRGLFQIWNMYLENVSNRRSPNMNSRTKPRQRNTFPGSCVIAIVKLKCMIPFDHGQNRFLFIFKFFSDVFPYYVKTCWTFITRTIQTNISLTDNGVVTNVVNDWNTRPYITFAIEQLTMGGKTMIYEMTARSLYIIL